MIEYATESFMECKEELEPLFKEHYEEIGLYQDKIALNPNWQAYAALEDAKLLKAYTARSNGKLVGYLVVLVFGSMHHEGHMFAATDLLYIDRPERKGFTAWRLIKFAERDLTQLGVSVLQMNANTRKPFGKLLTRMGFSHAENLYAKHLGGQ